MQVPQADMLEVYKNYSRINSLARKLKSKTCELCGAYCNDVEIYQVKKVKDLKDETKWEMVMIKNHRKTMAVCPSCHIKIHSKD